MPITISDGTDTVELTDAQIARVQQAINNILGRLPEAERQPAYPLDSSSPGSTSSTVGLTILFRMVLLR